ncbi:DNA-binding transcriptional regulator [Afipia sp. P52-10]|uniref:helix-turn-helix domain-containing protein n=1 Tax=Afipia sp. P52-10 TaxID=1429916 RepID=UPI0004B468BF|nr:hypothetical protein [Afipia sp. P52-10]
MEGAELKSIRLKLGLSAEGFARLVGAADGAHVRKWERTAVPPPVAVLAKALRDSDAVRSYFGVTLAVTSE